MIGVDFSDKAVNLCKKYYCVDGLSFVPGDAEHLPFDDDSFDAVVNVESSHCYGSMATFLAQVKRVLKPGGHFLFADFRTREQIDEQLADFHDKGYGGVFVHPRPGLITPYLSDEWMEL